MVQYDQNFGIQLEQDVEFYNTRSVNIQSAIDARMSGIQVHNPNITSLDIIANSLEGVIMEVIDDTFRNQNNPVFAAGADARDVQDLAKLYGLQYDALKETLESIQSTTFSSRHIAALMDQVANATAMQAYQAAATQLSKLDEGEEFQKGLLYVNKRFGFDHEVPTAHKNIKNQAAFSNDRQLRGVFLRYVTRQMASDYDPNNAQVERGAAHSAATNFTP